MNVAISTSTDSLKTALEQLPDFLALVAVGPNKAPYQPNWQRKPLAKSQVATEIDVGKCKAVGVLCGETSGGLVFLDCDGSSCDRVIEKLSGQDLAKALPKTVGITSGRPGRKQLIYRIPEADRRGLSTKKLKTSVEGEMLEFRWNGCQSVVIGHHPITGSYEYLPGRSFAECAIAEAPAWIISQMQPANTSWAEFSQGFELPVSEAIPLEICLSRENRELLKGANQGNRDNAGAKLARDLIGTANYLSAIAQPFTGEPQTLLSEFCQSCSPPLSDKDGDRLFHSAEKSNPNPTLNPEQIEGCIKGWLWRQKKTPTQTPPRVQSSIRSAKLLSIGQLPKQIEQFLTRSPSETELTSKVMDWASQTDKTEVAIWKLVTSVQKDCDRIENRKDIKQEVSHLSQIAGYQPNLRDYLNPAIAEPLNKLAKWMGTTSMAMLTTLLPTAASLLPVGTELELNPGTGHVALPILYTGIVAESGSGKSPAQKTILKPLFRLQAEAEEDYAQKLSDWEADKLHAKEEGEPPPPKPKPRDYFTTDATREALVQIQANQPHHGFLGWFDELSGLIKGQNQYRNGRGSDKESLLSGRDGNAQKIDRAGGKRLFVSRSAYSITGSTQPDILRSLMGDFTDPSGQWARFLWCFLPVQAAPYPEDAFELNISDWLYGIYKQLHEQPVQTYRLSLEAKARYIDWYNHLDYLRLNEVQQSLRAVYSKFKGDTGVLALLLHCLNAAIIGEEPTEEVSLETIEAAIKLSKFYLGQVKLVHNEGTVPTDPTSSYCKILTLSKRKGWVTARDIYRARAVSNRRMPLNKIRVLMRELVLMGLAASRNAGNRLEICAKTLGDNALNRGDNAGKSGDNDPDFGDNGQKVGDNAPKFGDNYAQIGDSSTLFEQNRKEISAGPPEESPPETVTRKAATVTTKTPIVTRKSATVTTKTPIVTTQSPSPKNAVSNKPKNFQGKSRSTVTKKRGNGKKSLRVGDICRYCGPPGGMRVTCCNKDLTVIAISNRIATVHADGWAFSHNIPLQHLRKK